LIDVSPDLLSFLIEEEERSRNIDLLDRAETALKSYNGAYYGDEVDGCSKVVSRDVAEVVDHMGVSVLRTFVSGTAWSSSSPMVRTWNRRPTTLPKSCTATSNARVIPFSTTG
jgi:hypothetical protein